MIAWLGLVLHVALLLVAAPLAAGLLGRFKARLAGRVGPPLAQPLRDWIRLARRVPVLAEGTSFVTPAAPYVVASAILVAASLVPGFTLGMAGAASADLIVIAGLLLTARLAIALAGLDAGSPFGAIGAARNLAFGAVAEPALILAIFALVLVAGSTNLDAIATLLREAGAGLRISLALALLVLLAVAIVDAGRLPVDNPDGHLELAMVEEAMLLEYSGRHLALLQWAQALRLVLWLDLIGGIFAPFGIAPADTPSAWPLGLATWAVRLLLLLIGLAVLESLLAKLRVFRVPEFLAAAVLLGALAVVLLFLSQGFA